MKNKKILTMVLIMILMVPTITATYAEVDFSKAEFFIDYIENVYYQEVSEDEIMEAIYNALFDSLDAHSTYFDEEDLLSFAQGSQGSYGGLGVSIQEEDGYIKIISVFDNTPASKAELQNGDFIIGVNGESMFNTSIEVVASKIKGEPGTSVTLTILRESGEFDVSVVREIIEIKSVEFEILEGDIAYLKISKFSENTLVEVQAAVRSIIQNQLSGIVVDVRDNPGGLVDSVVKISELFLEKDLPILNIDYKAFSDEKYVSSIDGINQPMVVLINGNSASASEIFASAMQDNNRAVVIGETTYGKGTVQSLKTLNDGTGFKLTIAEYLSANNNKIDTIGVIPDIEVIGEKINDSAFVPMNQKRTVNRGETSLNVYGAQQRLLALGYDLSVDGVYGPQTDRVLKLFQNDNGYLLTNNLDLLTVRHLNEAVDNRNNIDVVLEKALELLR